MQNLYFPSPMTLTHATEQYIGRVLFAAAVQVEALLPDCQKLATATAELEAASIRQKP